MLLIEIGFSPPQAPGFSHGVKAGSGFYSLVLHVTVRAPGEALAVLDRCKVLSIVIACSL